FTIIQYGWTYMEMVEKIKNLLSKNYKIIAASLHYLRSFDARKILIHGMIMHALF
ncbi:hypothetical protein ACJX0J_022931, partial [Zea mays]